MSVYPKASWLGVRAMLHSVYDQPDTDAVNAQCDRLLAHCPLTGPPPTGGGHLVLVAGVVAAADSASTRCGRPVSSACLNLGLLQGDASHVRDRTSRAAGGRLVTAGFADNLRTNDQEASSDDLGTGL